MWDGRDGEKHLTLNINTSDVQFLGKRRRNGSETAAAEAAGEAKADGESSDSEVPF